MAVTILYATVSGTVEGYAGQFKDALAAKGVSAELVNMESFAAPYKLPSGTIVYMTCTYYDGEHPDSAQEFGAWLEKQTDKQLSGTNYVVFGIGSSSYEMFCKASKDVDEAFEKLGGHRLAPVLSIDMDDAEPDKVASKWMEETVALIAKK